MHTVETDCADALSPAQLASENERYRHSRGVSANCASLGFLPAFLDTDTDIIYPSRFADGSAAPIHLLDGLPDGIVVRRSEAGRVLHVKGSVVSGFVRGGKFYTREEAACEA